MQITYHGITRDHKDWAKFLGITEQTVRWRVKHWGVERTVTTLKRSASQRRHYGPRRLTLEDKDRAVRSYMAGTSEDDIAANLGVSRRMLSSRLVEWGLKRKGTKPTRTVKRNAIVTTFNSTIRITIPA